MVEAAPATFPREMIQQSLREANVPEKLLAPIILQERVFEVRKPKYEEHIVEIPEV